MLEEWIGVKGFESLYMVSNLGRVKSLPRSKTMPNGCVCYTKECILKFSTKHYRSVSLYHDGKRHMRYVHRMVSESFIPNPKNKLQVNHINGNKLDNRVLNLEWATSSENLNHAIATGLKLNSKKSIDTLINRSSKAVIDGATGVEYPSAKHAAIALKINPFTLRSKLNGGDRNNTTLKYK